MATINVKIIYEDFTKMFRFSVDMLIEDALKEIKARFKDESGVEHRLFQNATKNKKSRWLKNNRTFKFYGIENGVCSYKQNFQLL